MISSNSATVKIPDALAGAETKRRPDSVAPKETDVLLGIVLEIVDGIFKNLFNLILEKPVLGKKAALQPEDILMWHAVRRVVSGDTVDLAVNLSQQDNPEGADSSGPAIPPREH
jgi:hypothetical protein